ncbi:MAG: PIN domain-containing protein [Acidobacteria bacterium]|nr:PIN domain-containing protein [Acidobacteriota bacterium]
MKRTLLLDSNIIIKGLVTQWTPARAVLTLCAARTFKLTLAHEVDLEVKRNLPLLVRRLGLTTDLSALYLAWQRACRPERIRPMRDAEVAQAEPLIAHSHDAPILAAAIYYQPDFLLTNNRRHFSDAVATTTGLTIVSDEEFFARLNK